MITFMKTTPVGKIHIEITSENVTHVRIVRTAQKVSSATPRLLQSCISQLEAYFSGKRTSFSLPLSLEGTTFQKSVWKAISRIPYGQTRTYGEIAKKIGRPRAVRAVGQACGANPVLIIVPCHRVVGSNSLGGYAGGLHNKKYLLKLEGAKLP